MATPKPKQVADAIKARLEAMTAPTYNYAPDKVTVHPFTMQCFDESLSTVYVIELDQDEHEEGYTTHENLLLMRLSVIGMRKLQAAEHPYLVDPVLPDRATEQARLEQDVMNRFFRTSVDIGLDGLVDNIASVPVIVEKGEETFIDGWAVIFCRFVPQLVYTRGEA